MTTAQPAPASLDVPHDVTLTFHVASSTTEAAFVWSGVTEVSHDARSSVAKQRFSKNGTYTVRVTGSYRTLAPVTKSIQLNVGPVSAKALKITMVDPPPGATEIGHIKTSWPCKATINHPKFQHLIEWKASGGTPGKGVGPSFSTVFRNVGVHELSVGLDRSQKANFHIYAVTKITHTSDHGQVMRFDSPITFAGTTNPSGFERYIPWNVDTMGDMHARASPTSGTGATFTTTFSSVDATNQFWAQVWGGNLPALADPDIICGNNNILDPGEECDGTNLNGQTCISQGQGFTGGSLSCNEDCTFDYYGCTRIQQPFCGDGICNAGENANTCPGDCSPVCLNGIAEPGEACDGSDLRLKNCGSFGLGEGTLACTTSCTFDNSRCDLAIRFLDAPAQGCDDLIDIDGLNTGESKGDGTCSRIDQNRKGKPSILIHSGQENLDETDLYFSGRDGDTPLAIKRRHLTRRNYPNSIFGPAWAFNYRHTLQRDPSGSVIMESFGRVDVFNPVGTDVWKNNEGRFELLTFNSGLNQYILRMRHGSRLIFAADPSDPTVPAILVLIVSRNENTIGFTYESALLEPVLFQRKLLTITESYGRNIDFFYEDFDYPDGASRIHDFSGREVIYDYNTEGQLVSVRSPTVTSTGGLNDFDFGKVTSYTYLNDPDPRLKNALTSVTFPNQNGGVGGGSRLEWTYQMNSGAPFFGHVLTHTVGNPVASGDLAAGGIYTYAYTRIGDALGDVNTPTTQIDATDRRGTLTRYEVNRIGHILSEKIFTHGLRAGSPPSYEKGNSYNNDGLINQTVDVLGTRGNFTFAEGSGFPRNSQGNRPQTVLTADSRGGDQVTITGQTVYEPIFNQPFKVIDPRGFETGHTPPQFTTTYFYDYMEDLAAAKTHFAPELGLTEAELQQLFDDAGITNLGDLNGDGRIDQDAGNLIKIDYPDVPRPAQASRVGLGPTEQAETILRYNDFGQLIFQKDAEENVTTYTYFGAIDPEGDGVIDVPGADTTTGGYLRNVVRDDQSAPGRESGQN
ncbi:MAG TPA: DUF6531 domain-containing protein, partial [Bdellovibrionota bacterium]|nr:DUF6531 domain-containing protein [Bdellovibrionota bacterium]